MHWLANMTIGRRLSVGFAAVIALLVVLAVLGINRIDAVLRNTELILHDRYANVALGHAIENDVNPQATALRTALITTEHARASTAVDLPSWLRRFDRSPRERRGQPRRSAC